MYLKKTRRSLQRRLFSAFCAVFLILVLLGSLSLLSLSHLRMVIDRVPEPGTFSTIQALVAQNEELFHQRQQAELNALRMLGVLTVSFLVLCFAVLQPIYTAINLYTKSQIEAEQQLRINLQSSSDALAAEVGLRNQFLCDVMSSVTSNKFHLHNCPEQMPSPLEHTVGSLDLITDNLIEGRHLVRLIGKQHAIDNQRLDFFVTAAGEGMMNAVTHAQSGHAVVCYNDTHLQINIQDQGTGISLATLPHATLEKGWSSAGSLGMGFSLMLQGVDELHLCTGVNGTYLVLILEIVDDPFRFFDNLLEARQ